MSYSRMARKFNRIHARARKAGHLMTVDLDKDAFVLFSDHHKGDGSSADDFKENAALYMQALCHYQERGFKLIVLGDSEDCWENSYSRILAQYGPVIKKEIDLAAAASPQKKVRIWGNHDKEISLRRFRRYYRQLKTALLDGVTYREGVCLGLDIFLVHGHQGRFFEDIAWRASRLAVKFIWKSLQKLFLIGKEGPAENVRLRDDVEMNYYRWAKKKRLLLICGHTHRAMFASFTHLDFLEKEILELKEKNEPEKIIAKKIAEREQILSRRQGLTRLFFETPPKKPVPCYFNAGCCCYANGMTCLEIEKGWIRLVKWQRRTGERTVLAEESVERILAAIKKRAPLGDRETSNSLESIS
jgi:UDP-2,3-diacylglucosamine pyrophosphatase LpxH